MNKNLDYGTECRIPLKNGVSLAFPSVEENPEGVDYVRFVKQDGKDEVEIAYWVCDEWAESPQEVMGAIMGAIMGGGGLHG